ncbi:MAG: multidrug transporter permease [Gammaproteobacteria bacterium]|nr:multidrug transporter permease [Gammaproteobacteria bacterium]
MKTIIFSEQALVRVWRNLKTRANLPTGHFGHAAVTITGNSVKGSPKYPHLQHISFWPGESVGLLNAVNVVRGSVSPHGSEDKENEMNSLTALRLEVGYCRANSIPYPPIWDLNLEQANKTPLTDPRPGQKRRADSPNVPARTYGDLMPIYSQSAEAKIYLPGLMARGRHWGLHLSNMAMWWNNFVASRPPYRALSAEDNCAGVALKGLQAGGSEALVKLPGIKVYTEPLQVEAYARELEKRFKELELLTGILEADNTPARTPVAANEISDGLWRFDLWKKASALGVLHQRSDTIREIDANLEAYQRLTWKYAFNERYAIFVKLFLAVVKHREEKSDSKRSAAVAQLGSHILKLLKDRRFYD